MIKYSGFINYLFYLGVQTKGQRSKRSAGMRKFFWSTLSLLLYQSTLSKLHDAHVRLMWKNMLTELENTICKTTARKIATV